MSYETYIDPLFLDKITYTDSDGKRRVKNPYRNRRSYEILVPKVDSSGNFVFRVPEDVNGKSVYVEFPNKVIYRFTVSAASNEVTVIGVPVFTYIEVNVVNPKPLPPTNNDLYWDALGYDAQKSIVAAWGDIELVCNVLYPATAESELGFDDQNTIKYGLVGWKNNCGNDRNTNWDRPKAPRNGVYYPPQPEPTPPQEVPTDPEIGHDYDLKFVLRWQNNSSTDLDFYAFLDHTSSNRVFYGNREYGSGEDKMWLDNDHTQHGQDGRETQPEIITVLGFKQSVLSIQINNYDREPITENVTVEILDIDQNVLKTFTIPSYALSGSKNYWVCDVELATRAITSKMKEIPSVGTFN